MEKIENIGTYYVLDDGRIAYIMGNKKLSDVNIDDLPVLESFPNTTDEKEFAKTFIYTEYIMGKKLSDQFVEFMENTPYDEERAKEINGSNIQHG